jgi:hypothetical protein
LSSEASHVRRILSPNFDCGSYDDWIQMIFAFLTKSIPVRETLNSILIHGISDFG